MGLKKYKPVTPTMRYKTGYDFKDISKNKQPAKSLLSHLRNKAGRNNQRTITYRHRSCSNKKKYRIIDYKRKKFGIPAKVASIEYDPNRSARIALLHYVDGDKKYIIAPLDLKVGDQVESGPKAEISTGNALPLYRIPLGTIIHNVEFKPGKGGQLARSAGSMAQVVAKENSYVHVKMPSGDVHLLRKECMATIGQVGNTDHTHILLGKAGRKRWKGIRPTVRGVAMNPVDHPMGGGEGRTSGGGHPVSPWGVPAKGGKTRRGKKYSTKYIIKSNQVKKK